MLFQVLTKFDEHVCSFLCCTFIFEDVYQEKPLSMNCYHETRIAPALLGLRQALKISIYDCLPIFHQITVELFLNGYNAFVFIAVSSKFDFGPCPLNTCLKTYAITNHQPPVTSQT